MDDTKYIQDLIDNLKEFETLIIPKGIYKVSNIYLKSNITVDISNCEFIATTNELRYDVANTRVAGINMAWYLAVFNIINCENVKLIGNGIINGSGNYWWEKYWGNNKLGGYRKIYDKIGLRWASDYDCMRIRNVLVSNSKNIILSDFTSSDSGFWNIHILYSNDVKISNIKITSKNIESPSTDGIDIDSSYNVEISNCEIDCCDDSVAIKSGRDYDGIITNIKSHDIYIHDLVLKRGFGITIGSEVSGGIQNVKIENIKFINTDCGIRFKSSIPRKGYIKDIFVNNLEMLNVKYLFNLYLDWNPNYSICKMPIDYNGLVLNHYKTLTNESFYHLKNTIVNNVVISNVNAAINESLNGNSRIFNILGFEDSIMENVIFNNLNIKATEYGYIKYANVEFKNVDLDYKYNHLNKFDLFDER